MHNILVNALCVTNQSGRTVLIRHLDALLIAFSGRCRFHVLVRETDHALQEHFGNRVRWCFAPLPTVRWHYRYGWEWMRLQATARSCEADLYFTTSGIASRRLSLPQVVYCMNPWALVPGARRRRDALKAALQRSAYRYTVRRADALVYLSRFMQSAYRDNAGKAGRRESIAYQPVCGFPQADIKDSERQPGRIVCASAMAPHKNIETLLEAFHRVRHLPGACLHLVGGWPDAGYQLRIHKRVKSLDLQGQVFFDGFVKPEIWLQHLAQAEVFCLMSRCESFGIPAVEAQSMGTPVISSDVCAIPEVCGAGGIYCNPDDVNGIARAMESLLTDKPLWTSFSEKARRNAERFTVENCTGPLISVFEQLLENTGRSA